MIHLPEACHWCNKRQPYCCIGCPDKLTAAEDERRCKERFLILLACVLALAAWSLI